MSATYHALASAVSASLHQHNLCILLPYSSSKQ